MMPTRPASGARRRLPGLDPDAGRGDYSDIDPPATRSSSTPPAGEQPAAVPAGGPTRVPAPATAPEGGAPTRAASSGRASSGTRAFTARLDDETVERFERLTRGMAREVGDIATRVMDRHTGKVRTGYTPSQADLLRALLAVADADPDVLARVHAQVAEHYRPAGAQGT